MTIVSGSGIDRPIVSVKALDEDGRNDVGMADA
jgi:hypothetical protein